MKKAFVLIATVVFFIALGFTSCKSTEDCPAYSKVSVENTNQNV
jgi:hypothetical protein